MHHFTLSHIKLHAPSICPGDQVIQALLEVGHVVVAENSVVSLRVVCKLVHKFDQQADQVDVVVVDDEG